MTHIGTAISFCAGLALANGINAETVERAWFSCAALATHWFLTRTFWGSK